jgi:hypothetical protein
MRYLYLLHHAESRHFKLLTCLRPAANFAKWAGQYFDLEKSCLVELDWAGELEQWLRGWLTRGARNSGDRYAYVTEHGEWFPAGFLASVMKNLTDRQGRGSLQFLDLVNPKVTSFKEACPPPPALASLELAVEPGTGVLDRYRSLYVGDRYMHASTGDAALVARDPAFATFLNTLTELRNRCAFLALLPKNEAAAGYAHQNRRCLVGAYPDGSGAKTRLTHLYDLNEMRPPHDVLWPECGIAKVGLLGRCHRSVPNEHGLVFFELEIKDPADDELYLAYGQNPPSWKPWLTLPADKHWYLQAQTVERAALLTQLPAGILGWDVPLPIDIYDRLSEVLRTPVLQAPPPTHNSSMETPVPNRIAARVPVLEPFDTRNCTLAANTVSFQPAQTLLLNIATFYESLGGNEGIWALMRQRKLMRADFDTKTALIALNTVAIQMNGDSALYPHPFLEWSRQAEWPSLLKRTLSRLLNRLEKLETHLALAAKSLSSATLPRRLTVLAPITTRCVQEARTLQSDVMVLRDALTRVRDLVT